VSKLTISVVETAQSTALWQTIHALVFGVDAEKRPRFHVRACDSDGQEWFAFRADSREEANQKLESELAEQGREAFLRTYSATYRDSG
jgi:hypothetical protein